MGEPGGGTALVGFLVDLWCAGLKDAWGDLHVTRADFEEHSERARARMGVELAELDTATARKLIAGGIRFARQNGFRLPAHYERWVAQRKAVVWQR